jgi:hypothetical protein
MLPTRFVYVFVAIVLLFAATLKWHQIATSVYPSHLILGSRSVSIFVVVLEFILASLLIIGAYAKYVRWAAVIVFGCFLTFSVNKYLSGESSCNCFGEFSISPIASSLLDIGVIALLLWAKDEALRLFHPKVTAAVCMLLSMLIVVSSWKVNSRKFGQLGVIEGKQGIVVLEPQEWKGSRFHLADFVDGSDRIMSGSWQVILTKHDCKKCQNLLSSLRSYTNKNLNIALVELPPFGSNHEKGSGRFVKLKLSDDYEWFAETPVCIQLSDGKVEKIDFPDY